MMFDMAMEYKFIQMVFMMGIGVMIWHQVRAPFSITMEIIIMVTGKMINLMGLEYIKIRLVLYMKVILRIKKRMDQESKHGWMDPHTMESSKMVSNTDLENMIGVMDHAMMANGEMISLKVKDSTAGWMVAHM